MLQLPSGSTACQAGSLQTGETLQCSDSSLLATQTFLPVTLSLTFCNHEILMTDIEFKIQFMSESSGGKGSCKGTAFHMTEGFQRGRARGGREPLHRCRCVQFTAQGCLGLGKLAGPCGVRRGLQLAAPGSVAAGAVSGCVPHLRVTQGTCLQLGSSWEGRRILAARGGSCCWQGSGWPPGTGAASVGPSLLVTSRVFGFAAW